MTTLKVHFDGRVLVPEEPVSLPRNYTFEVLIPDPVASETHPRPARDIPKFPVPPNAKILRADDLKQAQDD